MSATAQQVDLWQGDASAQFPLCLTAFDPSLYAANTHADLAVTVLADASRPIILGAVHWSFSAAPAAGTYLLVEDGSGNTVFKLLIAAGGPGQVVFEQPKHGTKNTALVVTLKDGGSGILSTLYVDAWVQK